MKTCQKMQAVVAELGEKFEVDLGDIASYMRLDMQGFDRLCIENLGNDRVSVAHYFEINGNLVAEPDVVFYTALEEGWVPIEITQSMTGLRQYAKIYYGEVQIADDDAQYSLADFCELWAQNLRDQGWLENAAKHADVLSEDVPF